MSVLTAIPSGGFTGSTHHNASATATFPVGTKIRVKQDQATGQEAGYCTFVYVAFMDGAGTVTSAAKYPAQIALTDGFGYVTCDESDANNYGPGLCCLDDMTDTYCGWGQCGGPACCGISATIWESETSNASPIDGNFTTDGSVAAGSAMQFAADGGAWGVVTAGTDGEYAIAIASAADSTGSTLDSEFIWFLDKWN